jgi:glycosyltransferase involved in cell wall biosynthesis
VRRLIASIKQHYPNVHVVVVDDSNNPTEIPGVEYHILPFATGISISRNFAVSKVKTKYFMTLDDDFVFTPETNLQMRYEILESTDIDMVGTDVADNQNRKGMLVRIEGGVLYRWNASKGESFGYPLHDYVPQCFLARTEKFRSTGGWDNDFLVWDHEVLFVRILGKLKITMLPRIDILHRPASNPLYHNHRWGSNMSHDQSLMRTKYGIHHYKLLESPPGWKEEK